MMSSAFRIPATGRTASSRSSAEGDSSVADVRIELKGFAELAEAMRQLSPKLETRGLNGANYAGAKVLVDAAKATSAFHDRTGALRKSIRAFRRRSHPAHQVTHAVGVSN